MVIEMEAGFWLILSLMILLFPLRFLAGVLTAAAVHELGHLAAIRLSGGKVQKIRIHASGAVIHAAPMERHYGALCALAGPAAGALSILAWRWFPEFALAGAVQTAFNLLPIPPLDGWVVLSCLATQKETKNE